MKKGSKLSEETIRKISGENNHNFGKPRSAETRLKISKSHMGKKLSEEHRKALSEAQKRIGSRPPSRLGIKTSEETKRKISKANKGQIISEEQRKQNSERMKGTHLSEETKRKIGLKSSQRKHSEETRKKIGEAGKGRKPSEKQLNALSFKGKKHSEESRKKMRESCIGKQKGDKNPAWRGGTSFEPYGLEFNDDLKKVIRNRDRRKCVLCEKTELENGVELPVHHIDYTKTNNNPDNLISLCRSCHSKTNHNREYWKAEFKILFHSTI